MRGMTTEVLHESPTGRAVLFSESADERAARIEQAAVESAKRFRLTEGQRRHLVAEPDSA